MKTLLKYSLPLLSALWTASASNLDSNQPNVVMIYFDDMGWGDLGANQQTGLDIPRDSKYLDPDKATLTPKLDAFAAQSLRFTNGHSADGVCTPSRYSVLTGRYCWRGRLKKKVLWSGYDRLLIEKDRKTIGNLLQSKGYRTAQIGKWHLGWEDDEPVDYSKGYLERGPKELGFDYSFVTASCQNMYPLTFVENHKILSKLKPIGYDVYHPGKPIPAKMIKWRTDHVDGEMLIADDWSPYGVDRIYTDKAIAFIKRHVSANNSQPFYLHLTPEAPHRPNIMPEFIRGSSQAGERGDHVRMADWVVGQITQTLSDLKIDGNTLVIFTSDNGPRPAGWDGPEHGGPDRKFGHKSAGELRGFKGSRWEGGHRVPFTARWPGTIEPGAINGNTICLTDMMATFAALTGYELSRNMGEDSFNALPVLLEKNVLIRDSIIHHDVQGRFSIRKGDWKLIDEELFNLKTDLREKKNEAFENSGIADELRALLGEHRIIPCDHLLRT